MRQLLLDPAVNREFAALRGEVEAKGREVKALQQELQAVNFSQDSKTGRMLMAKCRTLQVGMTTSVKGHKSVTVLHCYQIHTAGGDGMAPEPGRRLTAVYVFS